ncbi:hypothetical protein NU219Hw_g2470t1 [Hortaea werneckii]
MSQSTSLLDLPPELRLLIYEHLIGPTGRIYISFKKRGTRIQVLPFHGSTGDGHGLLLVCRQIRGEFLPIHIESAVGSARVIVTPVNNFSINRVQRFLAFYEDKFKPATNSFLSYGDFYDKEGRDNLEHWLKHPSENYVVYELSKKKEHALQEVHRYVEDVLRIEGLANREEERQARFINIVFQYYRNYPRLRIFQYHRIHPQGTQPDDPNADPFETSDSEES